MFSSNSIIFSPFLNIDSFQALQQQFNRHIFKMELLQCEMEEIGVAHIEFPAGWWEP